MGVIDNLFDEDTGFRVVLAICCCCSVIWIIICFSVGASYLHDAREMKIEHHCEVVKVGNSICEYACGQTCYSSTSSSGSWSTDADFDVSIIDDGSKSNGNGSKLPPNQYDYCVTDYCWGLEYIYHWNTLDWSESNYTTTDAMLRKVDTSMEPFDSELYAKLVSEDPHRQAISTDNRDWESADDDDDYLPNMDRSTDDESGFDSAAKVSYDSDSFSSDSGDDASIATHLPNIESAAQIKSISYQNNSDFYCDVRFETIGVCASWPYMEYYAGDTANCWTNHRCSRFVFHSPQQNYRFYQQWDTAGFVFLGCLAVSALACLCSIMVRLCKKGCDCCDDCCGRNRHSSYDHIHSPYDGRVNINSDFVTSAPVSDGVTQGYNANYNTAPVLDGVTPNYNTLNYNSDPVPSAPFFEGMAQSYNEAPPQQYSGWQPQPTGEGEQTQMLAGNTGTNYSGTTEQTHFKMTWQS